VSLDSHDIQEENVGAYLLGALSDSEARRFERHADECPLCTDELERLRPAVDALPRAVVPMDAPASLKTSIIEQVKADVAERRGATEGRLTRAVRAAGDRLSLSGRGGSRIRPGVAWASAAFVLAVGVAAGFGVQQLSTGGEDGGTRTVAASVDKTRLPSASGRLVVPEGLEDGAVLRVHGMPALENDSTYEVWLERDGEVIAQSQFGVGDSGEGAAAVADDLNGADAVLVTREPHGGSKAPSEEPVVKFAL